MLLILVDVALFATHRPAGGTSLLRLGVILTAISVTVGGRNDRDD
ncbi:hypothetical protein BH10ACT10_BH10ACT10_07290 [soil metagenome]